MNLLHYTKKLYEKINNYDKMAQNPYLNREPRNPFLKPENITIIWIEKKDDSDCG